MAADYSTVYALHQLANGLFTANAQGRAKFEDGFLPSDKAEAALLAAFPNRAPRVAKGASSSGVAGTAICSITAAAGRFLASFFALLRPGDTSSSHIVLTLTLSDDSTRTLTMTGGAAKWGFATPGGAMMIDVKTLLDWSADVDLPVKSIAATTGGAGTAERTVRLSAVEVGPLGP